MICIPNTILQLQTNVKRKPVHTTADPLEDQLLGQNCIALSGLIFSIHSSAKVC